MKLYFQNSLLSVPNTYDEDASITSAPFVQQTAAPPPPPSYPNPSISIMSGIAEENDESDEKRREGQTISFSQTHLPSFIGVVIRPSVPSNLPNPVRQQSENDDSGYDEKPTSQKPAGQNHNQPNHQYLLLNCLSKRCPWLQLYIQSRFFSSKCPNSLCVKLSKSSTKFITYSYTFCKFVQPEEKTSDNLLDHSFVHKMRNTEKHC